MNTHLNSRSNAYWGGQSPPMGGLSYCFEDAPLWLPDWYIGISSHYYMYSLNANFFREDSNIVLVFGLMPKKFRAMSCHISKTLNFHCSVQCYENSFDKAQLAKYFKFGRINTSTVSTSNILWKKNNVVRLFSLASLKWSHILNEAVALARALY